MFLRLTITLIFSLCQACAISNSQTASICKAQPNYRTTETFSIIETTALELAERVGPEHVLLVFDIDNTLLAMNQGLGSDQWFNWQFELLLKDPENHELFFNDIPELLDAQRLLYDVSGMSAVEGIQPTILRTLEQKNLRKILLTSRGPEMRDSTTRELERNGYSLDAKSIIASNPSRYYPYAIDNLSASGLGIPELQKYRLLKATEECRKQPIDMKNCVIPPELVSFQNALYMTSGQHKGMMLKMLLDQADYFNGNAHKAILFVDDTHKHVVDVYNTLCSTGIELSLFHYTHEEPSVKQFQNSDKSSLYHKWQHLLRAIQPLQ